MSYILIIDYKIHFAHVILADKVFLKKFLYSFDEKKQLLLDYNDLISSEVRRFCFIDVQFLCIFDRQSSFIIKQGYPHHGNCGGFSLFLS